MRGVVLGMALRNRQVVFLHRNIRRRDSVVEIDGVIVSETYESD